jgi:hypothetical protein
MDVLLSRWARTNDQNQNLQVATSQKPPTLMGRVVRVPSILTHLMRYQIYKCSPVFSTTCPDSLPPLLKTRKFDIVATWLLLESVAKNYIQVKRLQAAIHVTLSCGRAVCGNATFLCIRCLSHPGWHVGRHHRVLGFYHAGCCSGYPTPWFLIMSACGILNGLSVLSLPCVSEICSCHIYPVLDIG